MRIACFECLPLPPLAPWARPQPSSAQLRGQRQDSCAAGPSLEARTLAATVDEPRLTLEFPVGRKVELRAS